MDFHLKQWRDNPSSPNQSSASSALPLFLSEPNTNLSALPSHHSTTLSRMGSYFSLSQWQELELQALIFRHITAGADVPPQLLHLVKKSLITSPFHLSHNYYPNFHQSLLQSGYWGRAAMDPEPGRCRRTDGKKWRCSRDVVAEQKYCERHMHRGKNRSRKHVETPTSAAAPYGGGSSGGDTLKTSSSLRRQAMAAPPHFTLSVPSQSSDLPHLNQRPLRHLFDETDNATTLSISMPGNPSSDFWLKLGTGDEEKPEWGVTWETNHQVAPVGGPLAEVLRSSASNSSPTSVLHRPPPPPASD